MLFKVTWKRLRAPCDCGWYELDVMCCIPSCSAICSNSFDMKLDPWSVWILLGSPTRVKKLIITPIMFWDDIVLKDTASGNLVVVHIIVNIYWFPVFVRGNGPMQSMMILLNGSSTAGIGCRGAGGMFSLGFPTHWQISHAVQNTSVTERTFPHPRLID